ncbi:hypothetical protein EVAR_76478_1 [Eumeta japonica]|uniref:Uncharacterized protein n=1 Tax=Eumeta variegata TaxID=151549 RepID=A0A4C1T820_EUMVA|nr:hypothetical protein EVAR_76478_1 [Eumeta japonica]
MIFDACTPTFICLLTFSRGKRAHEPPESKGPPPPMHTRNPRGIAGVSPISLVKVGYAKEGGIRHESYSIYPTKKKTRTHPVARDRHRASDKTAASGAEGRPTCGGSRDATPAVVARNRYGEGRVRRRRFL